MHGHLYSLNYVLTPDVDVHQEFRRGGNGKHSLLYLLLVSNTVHFPLSRGKIKSISWLLNHEALTELD